MRYALTGSRDWGSWTAIQKVLLRLQPGDEVAHGHAQNGADHMVDYLLTRGDGQVRRARKVFEHADGGYVSEQRAGRRSGDIDVHRYPADWLRYRIEGRKNPAGMIRNRKMIEDFRPDAVVYFCDDFTACPGTANTVKVAEELGVPTFDSQEFLALGDTMEEEEYDDERPDTAAS